MKNVFLLIAGWIILAGCVRTKSLETYLNQNSQDGSANNAIATPTPSPIAPNPTANDINSSEVFVNITKTVVLNYSEPSGQLATGCIISNLVNGTESFPCECIAGVCTVILTPTSTGVVSFNYQVMVGTTKSNLAEVSLNSKIGISVSDLIVSEWGMATLSVNLSAISASPITVDYATTDVGGSATAGVDYISRNSTLTIPAGVTSKMISVPIFSNRTSGSDRDFIINLSNPMQASLVTSSAKVTIHDVDYSPLAEVASIDAGELHTCAVLTNGAGKCWGKNFSGQLGTSNMYEPMPADVSGVSSGAVQIAGGGSHSCALFTNGGVKCWGNRMQGQLGDNLVSGGSITAVSGLSSGVASITTGGSFSCALLSTGGVKCWGANSAGQIGDNTSGTNRLVPTDVSGLSSGVLSIASGNYFSCALLSTGALKCWGNNGNGQLGDGTSGTNRLVPTAVSGLSSGVMKVVAGSYHTCALLTSGAVKCWGRNNEGQIGDNTSGTNRLVPTDVMGLGSGVVDVVAGGFHSCAQLSSGAVKCWGGGILGDGTMTMKLTPTDVGGLNSEVVALTAGDAHTCALLSSRKIKCWGYNDDDQIGDNGGQHRTVPTDVKTLGSGVLGIAPGYDHNCFLLTTGGVKCQGVNSQGAIGDGTTFHAYAPTDVTGLSSGVIAISSGLSNSCALLSTGGVKCWGANSAGQIGDNTSGTNRLVPTDVSGLSSGVIDLTLGSNLACALLSTGAVKCWGSNSYGQIGDNTSGTNRLVPTAVTGLGSGVLAISAGSYHVCALLSTGAVKCWGYNTYGQIGDNTSGTNRLVPTDVSGLNSGVMAISAGGLFTCALLSTGAVKCWGENGNGQMGNNTAGGSCLVPTDVLGLASGVAAISAGGSHACALLSTGAVKCWGYNSSGEIGNGIAGDNILVPTDVSNLNSGVSSVVARNYHTCALTSAGGVKCWGSNSISLPGAADYSNLLPQFVVAP